MSDLIQVSFAPTGTLQFPRGSQLLLIGPPGTVKASFAIRYLSSRLKQNELGVYATTVWTPKQVREAAIGYCGKVKAKLLRVVDGVSCVTSQASEEPLAFQSLFNMNLISLTLLQTMSDLENGHLCIDSLSTLMTYSDPSAVLKFYQVLSARAKDSRITGIYLLEEGVHDPAIVAALRFSADGVLEVREIEVNGALRHLIRLSYVRGHRVNNHCLLFSEKEPYEEFTVE
ncbi:MAG: RAD55 family ATPase [Promethearchaeota archaeon]